MKDAQSWIRHLDLKPHPEGGYFRETYRSQEIIRAPHLPGRFGADRSVATAIYYLLEGHGFSTFHRIHSDEAWHFYDGSCLLLHVIDSNGKYQLRRLGKDAGRGEEPQSVVTHGEWFAAEVEDKDSFALVGCTVAPGFDMNDFEIAKRKNLLQEFPQHRTVIERLTKE